MALSEADKQYLNADQQKQIAALKDAWAAASAARSARLPASSRISKADISEKGAFPLLPVDAAGDPSGELSHGRKKGGRICVSPFLPQIL